MQYIAGYGACICALKDGQQKKKSFNGKSFDLHGPMTKCIDWCCKENDGETFQYTAKYSDNCRSYKAGTLDSYYIAAVINEPERADSSDAEWY